MAVISRRLVALFAAALAVTATGSARAQDYPNRPIKLVVAFTAGGTTDFVARLLAERLRTLLGQPIIVENRPGANGAIAAEYVAKSDPDGYTLFFTTVGAVAINPALRSNLAYDPIKDFAPVGMAVFNSTMLVVNAAMKVNSARELAALAKERPGAITIGITGIGAISHLGLELFQAAAGVKFQAVPYRGAAQAVTDLLCSATSRPSSRKSRRGSSRRWRRRRRNAPTSSLKSRPSWSKASPTPLPTNGPAPWRRRAPRPR